MLCTPSRNNSSNSLKLSSFQVSVLWGRKIQRIRIKTLTHTLSSLSHLLKFFQEATLSTQPSLASPNGKTILRPKLTKWQGSSLAARSKQFSYLSRIFRRLEKKFGPKASAPTSKSVYWPNLRRIFLRGELSVSLSSWLGNNRAFENRFCSKEWKLLHNINKFCSNNTSPNTNNFRACCSKSTRKKVAVWLLLTQRQRLVRLSVCNRQVSWLKRKLDSSS